LGPFSERAVNVHFITACSSIRPYIEPVILKVTELLSIYNRLVFLVAACATISKQGKYDLSKEINCSTAMGDIRALENEKAQCP
jgi:hypothetical protein